MSNHDQIRQELKRQAREQHNTNAAAFAEAIEPEFRQSTYVEAPGSTGPTEEEDLINRLFEGK